MHPVKQLARDATEAYKLYSSLSWTALSAFQILRSILQNIILAFFRYLCFSNDLIESHVSGLVPIKKGQYAAARIASEPVDDLYLFTQEDVVSRSHVRVILSLMVTMLLAVAC